MQNPLVRDWETSWFADSIRALAYRLHSKNQLDHWSLVFKRVGEFETLLFAFYSCEAALDEYIRTHGDWGDELIRLPAKRLPGGGQE